MWFSFGKGERLPCTASCIVVDSAYPWECHLWACWWVVPLASSREMGSIDVSAENLYCKVGSSGWGRGGGGGPLWQRCVVTWALSL